MDIVASLDAITRGGPTVLFLILAGIMWAQHLKISSLERDLRTLSSEFTAFRITYAAEKVSKSDLDSLKEMMREHNATNQEMMVRLIDRVSENAFNVPREVRRTGRNT